MLAFINHAINDTCIIIMFLIVVFFPSNYNFVLGFRDERNCNEFISKMFGKNINKIVRNNGTNHPILLRFEQ